MRVTTFDGNGNIVDTEDHPDDPADVAARTIEDRLRQALTANATYLAIATPTAAQQRAQVERLTRQTTALIRRELHELNDTAGT
jgi:hypothetical protein